MTITNYLSSRHKIFSCRWCINRPLNFDVSSLSTEEKESVLIESKDSKGTQTRRRFRVTVVAFDTRARPPCSTRKWNIIDARGSIIVEGRCDMRSPPPRRRVGIAEGRDKDKLSPSQPSERVRARNTAGNAVSPDYHREEVARGQRI